MSEKFTPVCFD